MPYKIGDKASLPENVQKLPATRRRQWVHVFNSTYAKCDADEKTCESQAFRNANGVVKSLKTIDDTLSGRGEKGSDPRIIGMEWANIQGIMEDIGISSLDFDEKDATQPDPEPTQPEAKDTEEQSVVSGLKEMYDSGSDANDEDEEDEDEEDEDEEEDDEQDEEDKSVSATQLAMTPDQLVAQKAEAEKCLAEVANGWPQTFGVPVKSFKEWEEYEKLQEAQRKVDEVSWRFQRITDNIMRDQEMSLQEKASWVARAADDMRQYVADDGAMKSKKGFWQRAVDAVRGREAEPQRVDLTGTIQTIKSRDGGERWLTVFSNKFQDREGEIIPEKAHKSYVEHVQKTGKYPELWLWHTPGTRIGKADYVDYDTEGFIVASGTYDTGSEHIVANLKEMAKTIPLGVSHGFFYTKALFKDKIYGDYDTDEISILPMESAANTGTVPIFNIKENAMALTQAQFLINAEADPEVIKQVEAGVKYMAEKFQDKGVAFREVTPSAPETKENTEQAQTPPQAQETKNESTESGEVTLAQIMAGITALTTEVGGIKQAQAAQAEEIKALKATDDEKIASMFQSKATNRGRNAKESESDDSLLSEEEQTKMNRVMAEAEKAASGNEGFDGPAAEYAKMGIGLFDPNLASAGQR